MKMFVVGALGVVGGIGLFTQGAFAQISPVSRTSSLYAWEHIIDLGGNDGGVVSGSWSSNTFDPFNFSTSGGGYTAAQNSHFDSGSVFVHASAMGTPISMGYGGADSLFTLVFNIGAPATYRLEGTQSRFIGDAIVRLMGPGVDIDSNAGDWPTPTAFLYEGTFTPGQYTFSVESTADFGEVYATLSVVPAPHAIGAVLAGFGWLGSRRRR